MSNYLQDVYVSGLFVVVDPPPDSPNAVYVDGPGPLDFQCTAFRVLNPGRKQALVTEAQRALMDTNGVPYQTFANLPGDEKDPSGGPAHVFGHAVYAYEDSEWRKYSPGSGTPEVLE